MLISNSNLMNLPVLSMQDSDRIATLTRSIIDPNDLKIIAFRAYGAVGEDGGNILDAKSIREYSDLGVVIDSRDEFVKDDDVIKISEVLKLNFDLIGLKVETKKGSKLGKIIDYTVTDDNFSVQQVIVKRPALKSFLDPELTIPRSEIVEVTDDKIIVKDEEKTIRERAMKEDFVPNFVNPFRKTEPAHSAADVDDSTTNSLAKS